MNRPAGARILPFLVRSERLLRAFAPDQAEEVQGLIATVRALPLPVLPPPPLPEEAPLPPLRHLARRMPAKARPSVFPAVEAPTRPDRIPAPRPIKKRHLRLVTPVEPPTTLVVQETRKEAPPDPIGDKMREAEGARALLLEIVRRAAYDWVLYRSSSRIDQKALALDAYTWLFEEDEDHANWETREDDEKSITSFVAICDALDLSVDKTRRYIKALTPNRVMSSGRPPENSRASDHAPNITIHTKLQGESGGGGGDFDSIMSQLLDFND